MAKATEWLDENVEDMFESFIQSKPSVKRLEFIHRWYNPEQNLHMKQLNPDHVNNIGITKFRLALHNIMQH